MTYQGIPATPPRLYLVWEAILARLRAQLAPVVPVQVYRAGNQPYRGGEGAQWWRVAVVPITRAYPVGDQPGRTKVAPFLVRAEVHVPADGKQDPMPQLEWAQTLAFAALHGWIPDPASLVSGEGTAQATVRLAIRRRTPDDPRPMRDPDEDVWFNSAEYFVVAETPDIHPG